LYTWPYHPRLDTIENWFNQLKYYIKKDKVKNFNLLKESLKNSIDKIKKVNHEILKEMHHCFYGKEIPKDALEKIEEYKYSPAEIVNYYMCNRNNENKYLSVLSNYWILIKY